MKKKTGYAKFLDLQFKMYNLLRKQHDQLFNLQYRIIKLNKKINKEYVHKAFTRDARKFHSPLTNTAFLF